MTLVEWLCCNSAFQFLKVYQGEIVLSVRLILHLITIGSVLGYVSHTRKKLVPTALAVGIVGCSLAALMQGVIEWHQLVFTTKPWIMGLVMILTIICLMSRGNVAKAPRILRRKSEES